MASGSKPDTILRFDILIAVFFFFLHGAGGSIICIMDMDAIIRGVADNEDVREAFV